MFKTVATSILAAAVFAGAIMPAAAADRDQKFFNKVEGTWRGPGEIVAGKYKGTKFVCTFEGTTPEIKAGMTLDGSCRVGVFSQKMSASIVRKGRRYQGAFLDGAKGKGLDVVGGNVSGDRVVMSLSRAKLRGAMMARLSGKDDMNVTISVKVNRKMVPVIGMSLKRVDNRSTASLN